MMRIFDRPVFLLCSLAVIPAVFVFAFRYRRLALVTGSFDRGESGLSAQFRSRWLAVRFVSFAIAWVLLSCAAASPRWGTQLSAVRQEGSAVVFVMDISRSMGVSDVSPDRLSFASRYASLLVDRLEGIPCAVVLAKGDGVLAVPLTADHRSVLDLLGTLSPALLSSPGTDLGRGVRTALSAFPRNLASARTIILFTDGDETSGSLVDAARAVKSSGASLVIVGMGTARGTDIDIFPSSDEKQLQNTSLREDVLRSAAAAAGPGSKYVNGSDSGSALRVLDAALPAHGTLAKLVYSPKPVYRHSGFLLAALFFLCIGTITGGLLWRAR
jgi:Ca-activated chloride channel family protein